jgi:Protein of unknown function (DUF3618)
VSTGNSEQIREEIEAAREELGETVEALAAKTDVAGRAKRKLKQVTPESATAAAEHATRRARQKPAPLVLGAFAVGFLILRHRRGH